MTDGVLSARWRTRLLRKLGLSDLKCFRCKESIQAGSRIHINPGYGKHVKPIMPRIYHAECFEAMFID